MKGGKKRKEERERRVEEETQDKGIPSILLCFLRRLHSPPPHDVAIEGV